MNAIVHNPKLQQFIAEQVQSGHFSSTDEVVEAAIANMMSEQSPGLTAEEMADLDAAHDEIERGEGVDFEVLAKEMRSRFCKRS